MGALSVAKNIGFIEEKRLNHRMRWFIAINGPNCTSFDESTRLSRIRPIGDRGSGCVRVNLVKRCVDSSRPLDLHRCVKVSPRVAM